MRLAFLIATVVVVLDLHAPLASAQTAGPVEVAAHLAVARSSEFDAGDVGLGGRLSWSVHDLVGADAEITFYPREFPDDRPFSRARIEGLFGVTVGPDLGRVRPFARVRPGFLAVRASDEPLACILIFPPPLSCELAAGRTLFTVDLGGGVSFSMSPRTSLRIDVGDRLVRYPSPVIDAGGEVRDDSFVSHDLRLTTGVGFSF